ncbi:unnamed protein product [Spirodela intermedia]|uniref:PIR2-like helical domain-containing protein n=1 Tax=Spirodela intermedia TaxID=51605 RepID=A0A7I8IWA0_SPIIN|nr:unnamed protein product [Spirodela intermedia]CAA6662090.1 unnamed protein product [Spirodela intermedia]
MATDDSQPPPSSSPSDRVGGVGKSTPRDDHSPVESPLLVWPVPWSRRRKPTPATFQLAGWDALSEKFLEELLVAHMGCILKTAIRKVASFGYTQEAATQAVLRCRPDYSRKDTGAKIVHFALLRLRADSAASPSTSSSSSGPLFEDLQQMGRCILAEMVCVLRMVQPSFKMADAMWCLLLCDLNLCEAYRAAVHSSFSRPGAKLKTWFPSLTNKLELPKVDPRKKIFNRVMPLVNPLLDKLDEWAEWVQLKVGQAALRLSRDKEELQRLRREATQHEPAEATERRILRIEGALGEIHKRLGQCNEQKWRLKEENAQLRREIKAAAAAGGGGVLVREERVALQRDLGMERRRVAQLRREIFQTEEHRRRLEARWREEERSKAGALHRAAAEGEERERLQASWKLEVGTVRFQVEGERRRFAAEIQRLEEEVSDDHRRGGGGEPMGVRQVSEIRGGLGRLPPCAHPVLCKVCSGAHEAEGKNDCPSCGARIEERVNVRLRDE